MYVSSTLGGAQACGQNAECKMRKLFALKEAPQEVLTAEEMEKKAKEDLARRYEQARCWKEERQLTRNGAPPDATSGRS